MFLHISSAAQLWVYIPMLYCVTSCDKHDSHCSQENWAHVWVDHEGPTKTTGPLILSPGVTGRKIAAFIEDGQEGGCQ